MRCPILYELARAYMSWRKRIYSGIIGKAVRIRIYPVPIMHEIHANEHTPL